MLRLADGTFLIGDHATGDDRPGAGAGASTDFLESELSFGTVRWLRLDANRLVTRGTWVEKPDLSKVDEIGWAQLMPGSGHGVGGFVAVSKFEVWGKSVPRMDPSSR